MTFVVLLHATSLQISLIISKIYRNLRKSYSFVGFFVNSYRNVTFLFSTENLLIIHKFFKKLIFRVIQASVLYYSHTLLKYGMHLAYYTARYENIQQCIFLTSELK
jgi:hypothetical protein